MKEDLDPLWEPWMRGADTVLEDEALVDQCMKPKGRRHPQSRSRGREQTPAEVALRLLLLKYVRNWSYETLEREVKANLVYCSFCRIVMEKVPDAKTLGRIGQALGSAVVAKMHGRLGETGTGTGHDPSCTLMVNPQHALSTGSSCVGIPALLQARLVLEKTVGLC